MPSFWPKSRGAAPVGLALLSDVRLDLLNNPLNLRGVECW
jgi:hypothetical protein